MNSKWFGLVDSRTASIIMYVESINEAREFMSAARAFIRPYPHEFTNRTKLKNGTAALLRPVKPEDEPMWHDLVASCSTESLHLRFGYMFKATTHEMATRFCFIDYDREIAIVAEVEDGNERKLIGVGRYRATDRLRCSGKAQYRFA